MASKVEKRWEMVGLHQESLVVRAMVKSGRGQMRSVEKSEYESK
jgi:hypothetical protein